MCFENVTSGIASSEIQSVDLNKAEDCDASLKASFFASLGLVRVDSLPPKAVVKRSRRKRKIRSLFIEEDLPPTSKKAAPKTPKKKVEKSASEKRKKNPNRPTKYKKYTEKDVTNAIQKFKDGEMSVKKASELFKVPSRTIYEKMKNEREANEYDQETTEMEM